MNDATRMRCPKCAAEYDAVAVYGPSDKLQMLYDPADHTDPRIVISLIHVDYMTCPRLGCGGKLEKAADNA